MEILRKAIEKDGEREIDRGKQTAEREKYREEERGKREKETGRDREKDRKYERHKEKLTLLIFQPWAMFYSSL